MESQSNNSQLLVFVLPLLSALISSAITAVITYFTTRSKVLLDLTAEYDKELREDRLDVYKELWMLLAPLARYSAKGPLTYQLVKSTSEDMRDWYFNTGGIYLSRKTRVPYFKLKDAMQKIINDTKLSEQAEKPIDNKMVKTILESGKKLRESLADDIGTRQGPLT
jgi:hypothetical protein